MKTCHLSLIVNTVNFAFVVACSNPSGLPGKSDLVSANNAIDSGAWDKLCKSMGLPPGCDLCQQLGWYGDGECDTFCPKPDPDCSDQCGTIAQSQITATATSAEPGYEPANALDGTASTFWHTPWDDTNYTPLQPLPQSITLGLGTVQTVAALRYTPPGQTNPNGIITGYTVSTSDDGMTFTQVAQGNWAEDMTEKIASFAPTNAAYVKLEATAGHNGFAGAGELNLDRCAPAATCGNGIVEPGEACDGGSCCSATCTIEPDGTACGSGVCQSGTCTSWQSGNHAPLQGHVIHVMGTDSNAIATANSAVSSGDTVFFGPGTYTVTSSIALKSGVLYHAEPNVTIQDNANDFAMSGDNVNNVIIDGFTINSGAGIVLDGGSGNKIINNTIQNGNLTGWGQVGVYAPGGSDLTIDSNIFTNDTGGFMFYNLNNLTFTHNTITDTVSDGVFGVLNDTSVHTGLVLDSNTLDNIGRMGIEIGDFTSSGNDNRPSVNGLRVTNNALGKMATRGTVQTYYVDIDLSIVPCVSDGGVVVSGNHLSGEGWGIEICAPNGAVQNNTMSNPTGIVVACSPGLQINGNNMTNASHAFGQDGGYCGGETIGTNTINGSQVTGPDGW